MLEVEKDYKELLESFNAHKVEYLIVGAHALAFHGAVRFTGDLDIFVRPEAANARRVVEALNKFGFASAGLTADDFTKPDNVVQLGVAPIRIDVITSLTGVTWEEAYAGKAAGEYGGVKVFYLGKKEFARNKRALGRTKDLADLEAIREE